MNQYQRKYNFEIHSIPDKSEEDLESMIEVAKIIEVGNEIDENDIDIVRRLPSRLNARPIIVKFRNYDAKKTLYEARWKLKDYKGKNAELDETDRIFINENLTKQRRVLFAEVRKSSNVQMA